MLRFLSKLQAGREATAGTEVDATTVLRGTGTLEDLITMEFPDENVGIIGGTDRSCIPWKEGKLTWNSNLTFEQFLHTLEAGLKTVGTGAADGSGTGKIYAFPLHTTAINTIKTYTLEGGDNSGAEVMTFSWVESFQLSWQPRQSAKLSTVWFGKFPDPGEFTAAISVPAVEDVVNSPKLYIDAVTTYPATTLKTASLLGLTMSVKTGQGWIPTANGDIEPDSQSLITPPEVTLDITLKNDATGIAEKAAWAAQTARSIKLLFEGTATGTPGSTYSKKTIIIQLVGKWESFGAPEEIDGVNVVTGKFRALYNATAGAQGQITVVAELNTVP